MPASLLSCVKACGEQRRRAFGRVPLSTKPEWSLPVAAAAPEAILPGPPKTCVLLQELLRSRQVVRVAVHKRGCGIAGRRESLPAVLQSRPHSGSSVEGSCDLYRVTCGHGPGDTDAHE